MNYRALAISGVKYLAGMPAPVSVGCVLTHRCNLHCEYCNFPGNLTEEMTTEEWKGAIDEFTRAGTIRFGFTGGEALLREDAPELLRHAKRTGATTTLCSNGILVPERIDELDGLDIYTTSLDGANAEIHDAQRRSRGNFEKAIRGIELALSAGKQVKTLTVLTPRNLDEVPGILDLADEMGFEAGFQPASNASLASPDAPSLAPEAAKFHEVGEFLAGALKEGRNLLSSKTSVEHMLHYPEGEGGDLCWAAGKYFCYIDPAGAVFPCHFVYHPEPGAHPSGRELGYVNAFRECRSCADSCPGCYIVPYNEMNNLFRLSPSTLWKQVRSALSW